MVIDGASAISSVLIRHIGLTSFFKMEAENQTNQAFLIAVKTGSKQAAQEPSKLEKSP